MDTTLVRLAILYNHPLLGEGVGRMLDLEHAIDIDYVEASNAAAVKAAIASRPDMIVVERTSGIDAIGILRRSPDTLVIEVGLEPGPTYVYRRQEIPGEPEAVLGLVRRLRGGHPTVAVHHDVEPPIDVERRLVGTAAH